MLNPLSTRKKLYLATDEEAVMRVIWDFLAQVEPRELAKLPAITRATLPITSETISEIALGLARDELAFSPFSDDAPLVRDAAAVFAAAAMRMAAVARESAGTRDVGALLRARGETRVGTS